VPSRPSAARRGADPAVATAASVPGGSVGPGHETETRPEERGARGVGRAVDRFGGRGVEYRSHDCPVGPREEGGGLLWGPCLVRLTVDGTDDHVRLANAILERDGRFKLVGFDNKI
jgi:hypothetical protein